MSKYPDSNTPNRSWEEKPLCIKKKLKVKMNFKRIKRTHDISFPRNRHISFPQNHDNKRNVYGWSNSSVEKLIKK